MAVNIGAGRISKVRFQEQGSNPAIPPAGYGFLFVKSDGVYHEDDAGNVTGPFGVGGSISDGDKGDIVVSGSGAVWTIDSNVVTFAKQQDIATNSLIGRDTAGTGDPENITLDDTLEMSGAGVLLRAAFNGDVTASAGSNTMAIGNDKVTLAMMVDIAASKLLGRGAGGGTGDPEAITLGSNLSMSGTTLNASGGSPTFSGAAVYDNAGQVIANNAHVPLTFANERYDTDNYHDNSTNPTRLTIPVSGKYHVGGTVYCPGGGGNFRQLMLRVNGTTFIVFDRRAIAGGGNDNGLSISRDYDFAAGDYVEICFAQDSGGNLTTDTTNPQAFWIHFLGA